MPFTSFDERNGARALAGDATWNVQQFISMALTTAQLPGQPIARVLGYEVVSFPGPQIALTLDRGRDYRRATVIDFRSHGGELATVDLPPGTSVLQALGFMPAFPGIQPLASHLQQATTGCFVNGVAYVASRALPADVDVVQFLDHPPSAPMPITFGPSRYTSLALPQVAQHQLPSLSAQGHGSTSCSHNTTPPVAARPLVPGDGRPHKRLSLRNPMTRKSLLWTLPPQFEVLRTDRQLPLPLLPTFRYALRHLSHIGGPPPLLPLSATELAACCDTDSPSQFFTVFDVHHHARELAARVAFTPQQLARLAFILTPEIEHPFDFRLLRRQVEGFRRPQLVIRDRSQQNLWVLPVAYPDLSKGVCTVALEPPASPLQLMIEVQQRCDTPVLDRHDLLHGRVSFRLDFIIHDPYRGQDLRRFDHASFHRAPTGGSQLASLRSPAVGQPSRPAGSDAGREQDEGLWLPVNPSMVEEHGITTVFVDTQRFGSSLCEIIVHSFGRGPCRFWI